MVRLTELRVAELPWPWNPFKCQWRDQVDRGPAAEPLTEAELSERFAALALSLTPAEVARCEFHRTDWKLAAAYAVELHRRGLSPEAHPDFEIEVWELAGGDEEAEAVQSFWDRPICWKRGLPAVNDGQHRTCALKLAGVEWVLVELG